MREINIVIGETLILKLLSFAVLGIDTNAKNVLQASLLA
jgi:hypothetical protein